MATTSVLGTVKSYIVAQLTADSDLAGVTISYSPPDPADITREEIFVYDAQLAHELPVIRAGRKPRNETGQISIAINAAQPGQSGLAAETRALVMFAQVEDLFADDPELNHTVQWARIAAPVAVGVDADNEGWDGLIRFVVEYVARLT